MNINLQPAYRKATVGDIEEVAMLHSYSWRKNYKGMWPDDYLNNQCYDERLAVWTDRLTEPRENQHVIVADIDGRIGGLACCYFADGREGTLLDNLHVHDDFQGRGIGRHLMRTSAQESLNRVGDIGYYLWVLSANIKSIKFYQRLGGTISQSAMHNGPVGIDAMASMLTWPKTTDLITRCQDNNSNGKD